MEEIAKRGHKIYFFAEYIEKDIIYNNVRYISHDSNVEKNIYMRRILSLVYLIRHIHYLSRLLLRFPKRTISLCSIERSIGNIIRKYNIDVIHSHFFYPSGECGVLSALDNKIPIIATLRGAELYKCKKLDYGAMLDDFFLLTFSQFYKYINMFTAPSQYLVGRLKSLFAIMDNKVKHIPNGILLTAANVYPNERSHGCKFITVANLIKLKNIEILLSTFARLKDKGILLTIIGNGPLRDKFETLIKDSELSHITILDEVPKCRLFQLIINSDCMIHPSLIEGMPNVILESLALGVPCLVSDIPVHKEIIQEGVNGFIFKPYDESDLESKILYIIKNIDKLKLMRDNCIESVKKYDLNIKIDSYIEAYRNAVNLR